MELGIRYSVKIYSTEFLSLFSRQVFLRIQVHVFLVYVCGVDFQFA